MTSIGGKAQEIIGARLLEHEKLVHRVMGSKRLLKAIEEAAGMISLTLASGGKVMFCGNGGSAADAQHWAAEIVGRFQLQIKGGQQRCGALVKLAQRFFQSVAHFRVVNVDRLP